MLNTCQIALINWTYLCKLILIPENALLTSKQCIYQEVNVIVYKDILYITVCIELSDFIS